MAMLSSIEGEIARLRFVPFPTRPKKGVKIVRVDNLIVADLGHDTVACSRDLKNFAYPVTLKGMSWARDLLDALHRLGVISEKAWGSHLADARKRDETSEHRYRSRNIRETAAALGIKLTKQQQRKLAPVEKAPAL